MREYERLQLELIVSEYRSRGYVVETEAVLPDSQLRFDGIARNDNGELVLLELVNANMSEDEMAARRHVIKETASRYPGALIDFRYVDTKQALFTQLKLPKDEHRFDTFRKLLRARLSPLDEHPENTSKQMLVLWYGYSSLLRAYARIWSHPQVETASILDLYNSFLKTGILSPAEVKDDKVSDDLFQMHDAMIAATQGALVSLEHVKQLRRHYQWLRKQVRSYKNTNFYEFGGNW